MVNSSLGETASTPSAEVILAAWSAVSSAAKPL
jgi:hypothetical protein